MALLSILIEQEMAGPPGRARPCPVHNFSPLRNDRILLAAFTFFPQLRGACVSDFFPPNVVGLPRLIARVTGKLHSLVMTTVN
jgi:hypothetical protein